MDRIVNDVLLIICEFLLGSHFQSLLSLSSTSNRYRQLSRRLLFRAISIKANSLDDMEQELRNCSKKLEVCNAFGLVRQIHLQGGGVTIMRHPRWVWTLTHEDDAFQQLESLLRRIESMSDLYIDVRLRKHIALFNLLSAWQPQCRLHLGSVQFRSLFRDPPDRDPNELALATSECLHSITAYWNRFSSSKDADYTLEAVSEMASGLAPNLKAVSLIRTLPLTRPPRHRGREIRKEWDGFVELSKPSQGCPALQKLSFWSTGDELKRLSASTEVFDTSKLRELTLRYHVSAKLLERLIRMNFTRLRKLHIGLEGVEYTDYDILAARFLQSLPPLQSLEIGIWYSDAIFEAIMVHHGATLRNLALPKVWTREISRPTLLELEEMQASCTKLESLTVIIKRSLGDQHEVSMYRALGGMARLQSLSLTLDSSNLAITRTAEEIAAGTLTHIPTYFDEFDLQPANDETVSREVEGFDRRYGHVRESLMNSALDRTLALQIFDTIATNKPRDGRLLESLEISNVGGGNFGQTLFDSNVMGIYSEVGRSWLISRNVRDDSRKELLIDEIDTGTKWGTLFPLELRGDIEPIFRRVWPRRSEETDGEDGWKNDWHSFPLRITDCEEPNIH